MAPVHRRMRAFAFGVAVALLATAAGRASAAAEGSSAAKHGDKGDKHGGGKNSCSALSDDCDFVTAGELEPVVAYADFTVSADDAGALTCALAESSDNVPDYACFVDETTGALDLGILCPSGYLADQILCAPYLTDDEGTYIDPWGEQRGLNNWNNAAYCSLPPPTIAPSTSQDFLLRAICNPLILGKDDGADDDDGGAKLMKKDPLAASMSRAAKRFVRVEKKN